mgnify:CR=1 FL=1
MQTIFYILLIFIIFIFYYLTISPLRVNLDALVINTFTVSPAFASPLKLTTFHCGEYPEITDLSFLDGPSTKTSITVLTNFSLFFLE